MYWLVNNVLSIAQQYYINKGADAEEKKKEAEVQANANKSNAKKNKNAPKSKRAALKSKDR